MKCMQAGIVAAGLLLAGCDGTAEPPAPKTDEPQSRVFETQIQAVKKAQEVQGEAQKAEDARQQQLEQQAQ